MLYLTTRDKSDAFTAHRVLRENRGQDGGFYLPFRMPSFSQEELLTLKEKSFGQCMADMLNLFFSCHMTGWDVEFSIGRYPVKLAGVNQRVVAVQLWNNQASDFQKLERTLTDKLCGDVGNAPSWVTISIRIAALFGAYGELLRTGQVQPEMAFDVAVPTGDFSWAMAVWYARQMGLPVANIICGCYQNSAVWELLHLGEARTDELPEELERLVFGTLGIEEVKRYCGQTGTYRLLPADLERIRKGLFAAVVSQERVDAAIPSVYRTGGYILGPSGALAYSALQDYRARSGESRLAILLEDRSPLLDSKTVARAMGITEQELKQKI